MGRIALSLANINPFQIGITGTRGLIYGWKNVQHIKFCFPLVSDSVVYREFFLREFEFALERPILFSLVHFLFSFTLPPLRIFRGGAGGQRLMLRRRLHLVTAER